MKKFIVAVIVVMIAAIGIGASVGIALSANAINESVYLGRGPDGTSYSLVQIGGHEYLTSARLRAVSTVHSESCPCRNADVVRYKKMTIDGKTWLVPECGRGTAGIPLTE